MEISHLYDTDGYCPCGLYRPYCLDALAKDQKDKPMGDSYTEQLARVTRLQTDMVNDPILEQLGGRKDDDGKLRYDLIPGYALEELANVYTIGAGKYADHNWRKGMRWGRLFSAMCRHAWAWWTGERNDPQDGQHHLASVAWIAFTLMEYEKYKLGEDDRWSY